MSDRESRRATRSTGGRLHLLWPFLRRRWPWAASALGFGLVLVGVQIATPRVLMAAIDDGLSGPSSLTPFVVALAALGVARAAFGFGQRVLLGRLSLRVEMDLRADILSHLLTLSFAEFDSVQTGQVVSRANTDVAQLRQFMDAAPGIALNLVSFVVAIWVMLTIDVRLTIAAAAIMPLVFVTSVRMRRLIVPTAFLAQARAAEAATLVEENVAGATVVRSFAAEARQLAAYADVTSRLRWASQRLIDIRARYVPVLQTWPRLGVAAALLYGGSRAIHGDVTVGALVAFLSYLNLLTGTFMVLSYLLALANQADASARRIGELLDVRPSVANRPGARLLPIPSGALAFEDVTFGYGDTAPILRGLTLHVAAGETVAVVGRVGCGKSTLARLLARFYDVRAGAVRIDGADVRDVTLDSLREHVVVVPDEPVLFSASLHDNLSYACPDATPDEVRRAADDAGVTEFAERLPDGFETVIGERGHTLSGGQRQRVALARALLVNPRVLVLDDATSALDVQTEQQIHRRLDEMLERRTTILLAHRLSTVRLADRIVFLDGGRIAASGRHDDLMANEPDYAELFEGGTDGRSDAALAEGAVL